MPKFAKTFCSQCGQEFGPGDHGFSHCSDHQGKIMYSDGTMSSKTPNAVEGNGEQDQLPPMPRFVSDEHDARYEFSVPRTTYEDLRDEYVDLRAKAQALQEQLNELQQFHAEVMAGCDIQKPHGLYRQCKVVIGPGQTENEIALAAAQGGGRDV
jgi:hypothetical protein